MQNPDLIRLDAFVPSHLIDAGEVEWFRWDGCGWSIIRGHRAAFVVEPACLGAELADRVAQCCRDNGIEQYRTVRARPVRDVEPEAVAAGADSERYDVHPFYQAYGRTLCGRLKQHVRLPASHVSTRVGLLAPAFAALFHPLSLSVIQ